MLYSVWGAFKKVLDKSWKFQLPELLPLQSKRFPHENNPKIYTPSEMNFLLASSLSCQLFFSDFPLKLPFSLSGMFLTDLDVDIWWHNDMMKNNKDCKCVFNISLQLWCCKIAVGEKDTISCRMKEWYF